MKLHNAGFRSIMMSISYPELDYCRWLKSAQLTPKVSGFAKPIYVVVIALPAVV